MSIHYKFKSSLEFDTVTFDGLHISVKDLKKQILLQKKIGKSTDFDLQITNAQTKETYTDENELISKNTSLIVARVPVAAQPRKPWDRENHGSNIKTGDAHDAGPLGKSVDLSVLDLSEEDKIKTMMSQSTSEYDPSNYIKVRGANQVGVVPATYLCNKCHQRGHWIKDCKNPITDGSMGDAIRKSTGIPRSFMVPVDGPQVPGARLTASGEFVVPAIDHEVYKEKKVEKPPFLAEKEKPVETTPIPDDLLCVICKDLMTDAVMAPCCGHSFCDECIRGILVESDDAECPECNEKDVSPDTLIPNRFIRNAVNNFKNQTGYTKRSVDRPRGPSPPRPSLPDFVPPGAEKKDPPAVETENIVKEITKQTNSSAVDLYDVAVENDRKKDVGVKERSRRSKSPKSKNEKNDTSPTSSHGSPGAPHKELNKPAAGKENVYSIPSLAPVHSNDALPPQMIPYQAARHSMYPHGGDRSGTPTVDERFEPYGRPVGAPPLMPPGTMIDPGFPPIGTMYNPHYPPPLLYGNAPGGYRDHGRGFRGRFPGRFHQPPGQPHLPADDEEAFQYFQRMLKDKEERDRRKHGGRQIRGDSRSLSRSRSQPRSRSRSKSPSVSRRRSYTPKRSRSRSRSIRRSRSLSHGSRARSFVFSRSRSRSYSKSPIERKHSPRSFNSPSRSPPRYDRNRDYYGGAEGGYVYDRRDRERDRDRRGGYRFKGGRPHHLSPTRHNPGFNRYREDYDSVRTYSPDRYVEPHGRVAPNRWNERNRGRSRSGSPPRAYYEEEVVHPRHPSEGRDRRSNSRLRRERTPNPRDRHRNRDGRDRNGRRFSREISQELEREESRRNPSPDRKRIEKDRSRSHSRHRSQNAYNNKEQKKRSMSPQKQRRKSKSPGTERKHSEAHVKQHSYNRSSPSKETSEHVKESIREQVEHQVPQKMSKHLENRLELDEPLARNPSPIVSEKQKPALKKEKKKDKEKKKKKKEKETDPEKEARKKKKKEKKEKKKKEAEALNAVKPSSAVENLIVAQSHELLNTEKETDSKVDESAELPLKEPVNEVEKINLAEQKEQPEQAPTLQTNDEELDQQAETDQESYLELHASYETFGEPEMLAPMPEPSRWELEDAGATASIRATSPDLPRVNSVTSEVLKRAENAIFKKAISALRPESSKKSTENSDADRKVNITSDRDKEKRNSDPPEVEKKVRDEASKRKGSRDVRDESLVKRSPPKQSAPKEQRHNEPLPQARNEDAGRRMTTKEPTQEEQARSCDPIGKDVERVLREVKGKSEGRKPGNSIQITVSVDKIEREQGQASAEKKHLSSSPPARVSIKDRLGGKIDGTSHAPRLSPSRDDRARSAVEHKRLHLDEEHFRPMYDETSEEEEHHSKARIKRERTPEARKRGRSSSESSDRSVKKLKKKRSKHKKEKRTKKRKEASNSSESSDSEVEKKKSKKAKKKKKSRH